MKKLFFILLGLVLLFCAIDASVDFFYFAGPGKEKATQLLSQKLGTSVSIEKLKFRLLSGFSARNVVVAHPQSEDPLVKIEKLEVQPSYLALLSKKFLIKKLKLRNPHLNFVRTQKGFVGLPLRKSPNKREPLLVKKFYIQGGSLDFIDEVVSPTPLKRQIKNINVKTKLTQKGSIKGSLSFSNLKNTLVEISARYHHPSGEILLEGSTKDLSLELFKPYLSDFIPDLKELSGKIKTQFKVTGSIHEELNLQAKLIESPLKISFTPWEVFGQLSFLAQAQINIQNKTWEYQGEANINDCQLNTSLLPTPIENINGKFLFENNFLTTNGIEGTLDGRSIRVRGSLENLRDPRFHASLFTDMEPNRIYQIAKVFKPALLKNSTLTGKSFTQINIRTDEPTGNIIWNGNLYLKDATLNLKDYSVFYKNINGSLSFSKREFKLDNLSGNLLLGNQHQLSARVSLDGTWPTNNEKAEQDIKVVMKQGKVLSPWLKDPLTDLKSEIHISPEKVNISSFSGKTPQNLFKGNSSINLKNGSEPEITFYISSPEYSLLLQGTKLQNHLVIKKLNGYGFGTTFDISGKVPFSLADETQLQIESKISPISLRKSWPILWEKAKWLQTWSPEGPFHLTGTFSGIPKDKQSWKADALIEGNRVKIRNVFLDQFQMKLNSADRKSHYQNIEGIIGEGQITGELSFDFNHKPSIYQFQFQTNNVSVKKISKLFTNSEKEIPLEGNINGSIKMNGLSKMNETAIGEASILISDGRLWETPVLKPIWVIIRNFAPRLQKPVFKSVQGDFQIEKGDFKTDNLVLTGPGIILKAKGRIGLNQKVNMVFNIQFLEPEGSKIQVLAAKGLNLFGQLLEIEYSGTLSEPIVKRRWLPLLDKLISGK